MSTNFKPIGGLGETATPSGKVKKPRAKKTNELSLDELYAKAAEAGKMMPSVRTQIIAKEDFSRIQDRYCNSACGLCSSSRRPKQAVLTTRPVDIVVLQDHNALAQMYKSSEEMERIYRDIIGFLAQKHFQRLSYAVVNTLKCLPQASDLRGQTVTVTKLKPCAPYLHEELRRIAPKVIIVLSTGSIGQLGIKASCSTNRGEFHTTEYGTAVITLHPKALTMIRQNASGKEWGPDYFEVLDRDFAKAAKIARGDLKVVSLDDALKEASTRIRIARSIEDVREMIGILNSLPMSKVISFDLETTSLDAWAPGAKILTAQFGYTDTEDGVIKALVFPLWHRENNFYDPDRAWPCIAEILLSQRPKVGHNIKFDIIYTFVTTGVRVVNAAFDTLLLLHAINSGLKNNYSLKKAAWEKRLPHLAKLRSPERKRPTS
eukprot:gnl/Spiro4/6978_TR3621_c0_g1_i1.p1 gnl/Spiro4/6978_TR3621_c0_g1~~gnl/Spiro4/6978_TR3621_c0_g1_i1.p1  ORF type:complete len:432 (+),score=17.84 gnl/Spiro4/6978_TR3621_c0_g1_i1:507-1802(+)